MRQLKLQENLREGWALTGSPLRGGTVLTGRAGRYRGPYTGRPPYGKAPTRRLLTRRPLTNYRKAYRKLRGGTLPELDGNFRLCAVDQKRPFFPRAGPFLDLLPFKGFFSLTGALTGPPYGKAPYGEASYGKAGPLQEAPYEEGRSLREGPGPSQRRKMERLTGRPLTGRLLTRRPLTNYRKLTGSYGEGFYQNWREFLLMCRRPKKAVFS